MPSTILIHPAVWPQLAWAKKWGAPPPFLGGERGPHLTQSRLGRSLTPYQVTSWSMQPFGRNGYGPKIGCWLCPFEGEGAGSPSNTMWPGPRHTCLPSFILIRQTVWPQYTNVTDRQTGQDRQTERRQTDSIGRTVYKRSPKNGNYNILAKRKVIQKGRRNAKFRWI